MKQIAMSAALILGCAGAVGAFEVTGGQIGVQYGTLDVKATTNSGKNTALFGGVDFSLGDNADFSIDLNRMDGSLFLGSGTSTTLSLLAEYQVSDAFGLGLFADRYWANSALAMDQTVDHYGIQGTVTFDPFTVTAFAGRGWNHIGLSTDITGIDVGFQMDNGFDFGLFYRSEAGTGATIKQYGASVGYDISRGSAMPVYVTASFANTEFLGVGDSRLFRVGITIPLGQTVKRGETFFHPHSAQLDILSFVGTDTSGPAVP